MTFRSPSLEMAEHFRAPLPDSEVAIWSVQCRCPHCDDFWAYEIMSGDRPVFNSALKIGAGLLCGRCEALRRSFVADSEGKTHLAFSDASWGHLMDKLWKAETAGTRGYDPVVTQTNKDPTMFPELIDEKDSRMNRILFNSNGSRASVFREKQIEEISRPSRAPQYARSAPPERPTP